MICLFGMSCVGKSTIGSLLAKRLNVPFIDMDDEIKEQYSRVLGFQEEYPDQRDRDEKRCEMIENWFKENKESIVAVSPVAYIDTLDSIFENEEIHCLELIDTPENIFKRLVFTDDNDKVLHIPQSYLDKHKKHYIREIKADYNYFHGEYKKVMNSIQMNGKTMDQIVDEILGKFS